MDSFRSSAIANTGHTVTDYEPTISKTDRDILEYLLVALYIPQERKYYIADKTKRRAVTGYRLLH